MQRSKVSKIRLLRLASGMLLTLLLSIAVFFGLSIAVAELSTRLNPPEKPPRP